MSNPKLSFGDGSWQNIMDENASSGGSINVETKEKVMINMKHLHQQMGEKLQEKEQEMNNQFFLQISSIISSMAQQIEHVIPKEKSSFSFFGTNISFQNDSFDKKYSWLGPQKKGDELFPGFTQSDSPILQSEKLCSVCETNDTEKW